MHTAFPNSPRQYGPASPRRTAEHWRCEAAAATDIAVDELHPGRAVAPQSMRQATIMRLQQSHAFLPNTKRL